jgi:phytanoyl-CoA hydroxylase
MLQPTSEQVEFFQSEGFLVVESFIDPTLASRVASAFEAIFRGNFDTTVPPDEWRWVEGRDPEDVTRMIWNGWKSSRTVAELALSEQVGSWVSQLGNWKNGARLNQDGCLWKPPGAAGLAYHQDGNYIEWIVPSELVTCWIALDDVTAESGAIEYARGSHSWGLGKRPESFHKPSDYRAPVYEACESFDPSAFYSVAIPAGGAAFHSSRIWHGSGPNTSNQHRRALALHCMPAECEFHPTKPAFAQGRFKKFDSLQMDESFYPIIYSPEGKRSAFIEDYLGGPRVDYRSHAWRKS